MRRLLVPLALLSLASTCWAQAEPAPPEYVPPNRRPGPRANLPDSAPEAPPRPVRPLPKEDPKWYAAIAPRMVVRLGDGPPGLPLIGYGGGLSIGRALVPIGRARFGVGFRFAYDRIFTDRPAPLNSTQFLSHATIGISGVFDALFDRVRPYVSIGGGLSVASYEDPPAPNHPGASEVGVAGLVQLAVGVAVRVYEGFELGLHGEFDFTFSPVTEFTPGLFVAGLDLGFRF